MSTNFTAAGAFEILDAVNYMAGIGRMHGGSKRNESSASQVDTIRQFNRFFTQRIGVLDESLLASGLTLTQGRVLFELGAAKTCTAGDLIAALRLDAGYLSRIIQDFVDVGFVKRKPSPDDGRRALLSLTPKGRRKFAELDDRSRRHIGDLISPLSAAKRSQLLQGMKEVQNSLAVAAMTADRSVKIRPYGVGDIGWAIELHGRSYFDEFGWNQEFEALVATLFARFAANHDPTVERFWVAEVAGERIGCVFLVRSEKQKGTNTAQLRCLLVDPKGRGLGVGRKLVSECIRFARSAGYREIMLWTNDVLLAARRVYEAAGFSLIEESPHRSFGHELVGQYWSRTL